MLKKLINIFTIEIPPSRNVGLDIMRAIGVLMVFSGHSLHLFQQQWPSIRNLSHLFRNGVELFFALSGFLIGNIILKLFLRDQNYSVSGLFNFYKRRWLRTLPLYYIGILLNLLVAIWVTDNYHDFNWKFLFFLQNTHESAFWFFPISYSLSIEEWFYLSFPLLFLLLRKFIGSPQQTLLIACLIFIFSSTLYRYHVAQDITVNWDIHIRKAIFTRLDCSIYGLIFALFFQSRTAFFFKFRSHMFLVGMLLHILGMGFYLFAYNTLWNYVFYFNIIPISFVCMLPAFYFFSFRGEKWNSFFMRLSLIAYAFYILHLSPLMEMLHYFAGGSFSGWRLVVYFAGYTVITFTSSVLLYKYIEKPLTSLRDR